MLHKQNIARMVFETSGISMITLCCALGFLLLPVTNTSITSAWAATPKIGQLNPTGRNITMPLPLKASGRRTIGELPVRISPKDVISISKPAFIQVVSRGLRPEFITRLKSLKAQGIFISLTRLKKAGFDVRFDAGKMEVSFYPKPDQRPEGQVSLAGRNSVISSNLEQHSDFSGYLNIRSGLDYDADDDKLTAPRFDFQSVISTMNMVLENEMTLDGSSAQGNSSSYSNYQFKRRGTRLVYDMVEKAMRFQLGDVKPLGTGFQSSSDLLGLSVEKSYRKLQPGKSIRPTGRRSFRLQRPSTVDVMINGGIVRKLRLRAGDYNLSDLPLRAGANDMVLRITDDLGQTQELNFSTFSSNELLAPGLSEWSFATGVRASFDDSALNYDYDDFALSGFYRQGLSDNVTIELDLQADVNGAMGGAGFLLQTPYGFFNSSAALSHHTDIGTGVAANLSWSKNNALDWDGTRASYGLAIDYFSDDFANIETDDPSHEYWLRLAAHYSRPIGLGISASLSARYAFANDLVINTENNDEYGLDLGLSTRLAAGLNFGVNVGYTSESFSNSFDDKENSELHASFRLSYQLGRTSRVSTHYDTRDHSSSASYTKRHGQGVGSWSTGLDIEHNEDDDNASASGNLNYIGNRAQVSLSHSAGFDEIGKGIDTGTMDNRTSLQVGTAIAFADGKVAVGRPIGSGFAIVSPHESLDGANVSVGTKDNVVASSGLIGPALVPNVSAHSMTRLQVDVDDLPLGYDLGSGAFDMMAPYKAGFNLTVGSDYTVSAYGRLIDQYGEPVKLLTGTARQKGRKDGRSVQVFTNRSGRFGAQGLAEGSWVIEMATTPVSYYRFTVPKGTVGLHKTGVLKPVR